MMVLKGRGLAPGVAEGIALVSQETLGLARIVPTTGIIKDRRVAVYGQNVKGRVLVFPTHKASTTTPCIFLETVRLGNAPVAIINLESETMVVMGSIMAKVFYNLEIPVVDRLDKNPLQVIRTGDTVRVDGYKGVCEVL
jgi:hypothetical protein